MRNVYPGKFILIMISLILVCGGYTFLPGDAEPLVLQEMTWPDVREYLKTNDMVIIPLGSTEQHGPHLPLGTDYYEALEVAKKISRRTGVVVAPVLLAGYSVYHSGFPGTLSLKPETMGQVLFETAEMLMKYGFRRFMFFNYHGGNGVVESKVMHRINHTTEAVAVNIGIGAPFQKEDEPVAPFDYHAGIGETSIMLYLKPRMVRMERCQKPTITLSPKTQELQTLSQKYPHLSAVLSSVLGVPVETRKGGASHEISSNGIWTLADPGEASKERGQKTVDTMVEQAVKFILAWKQVKK